MKFQSSSTEKREIQMAPLIDIVFLLLIFFMVTATYAEQEQAADVKVPTSDEGIDRPKALTEITVNVTAEGDCIINGITYSQDELLQKLRRLTSLSDDGKAQPVRIRGDKDTKFQEVVKVIDVCQKAEIWNISFAVKKPKSE